MEKRIFGRRYNTDTAKSITEDEYFSPRDIWSIQEGVYLKRTGEYFFAAKGGAGTRYSNVENGNCVMGMVIVPLRNFRFPHSNNARQWMNGMHNGPV